VSERSDETLGERLARAVAHKRRSLDPRTPWTRLLEPVLARVAAAPAYVERFRRVETQVVEPTVAAPPPTEAEHLASDVRERLRPLVGGAADVLRVHDDDRAHRLAVARGADAVAVGPDVYFRAGRFRPLEQEGFALLAHEARHVAESLGPDATVLRASAPPTRTAEENAARALERTLLASPAAMPPPARGVAVAAPAVQAHVRPMAADVDRPVPREPRAQPAPFDASELRRELQRELLEQIRTDYERGG
jgi:hypothetical protein